MKHDLSLSTIYTSILSHEMTKQYEFLQRTRNKNATHSYKHPFIQQNPITTIFEYTCIQDFWSC